MGMDHLLDKLLQDILELIWFHLLDQLVQELLLQRQQQRLSNVLVKNLEENHQISFWKMRILKQPLNVEYLVVSTIVDNLVMPQLECWYQQVVMKKQLKLPKLLQKHTKLEILKDQIPYLD